MAYVMCYVGAVPTAKKAEYEAHASKAAGVFKEFGATRIVECWGSMVPPGETTSFPLAVQAKDDETVVMGWQEWPDKETHEANFQQAMQDPRLSGMRDTPVDGKRLIFAGFDVVLDI